MSCWIFKTLSAVSAAGSSRYTTLATFNAGGSLPENGDPRISDRVSVLINQVGKQIMVAENYLILVPYSDYPE